MLSVFDSMFTLLPFYFKTEVYFFFSLFLSFASSYLGRRYYLQSRNVNSSLLTIIRYSVGFYLSLVSLLAIDYIIATIVLQTTEFTDISAIPIFFFSLFLGSLFVDFFEKETYVQLVRFYRWFIFFFSLLIVSFLIFLRIGSFFVDITPFAGITGFLLSIIIGILSNIILKQKQSEQKARMNEQKYYNLLDLSPDAVVITDANKVITMVNKECLRLFGYDKEEDLVGQFINILFSEIDFKKIDDLEQNPPLQRITRFPKAESIKQNGESFITEINRSYFVDDLGDIDSFVMILRDISERERLKGLQDRFISMTSHELRTPLTAIKGYTDFLSYYPELPDEQVKDINRRIRNSIRRLERLVKSVHEISLMRNTQFKIVKNKIEISNLINAITSNIHVYKNPVFINLSSGIERADSIFIDIDRILQVIDNLISNGVKNSAPGSPMELEIDYQKPSLVINILDYGCGIPLSSLVSFSQPFSHQPSKFSSSGTGLGLFIVKQIIMSHQGSLEVFTSEDFGTIISIKIPTEIKS